VSVGDAAGDRPAAGRAPLVLIVDDYADSRQMYTKFLTFKGLQTTEAADGHAALQKAHELHPDVILMDLSLPGMDGWQATRELKADRRTQRIPIIVITGHALAGVADSARAAGCDAFITKPCSPEDALAEIQRLLAQAATDPLDRR
jgi:two-component system, cell cycle response regulator DivK